jgi:hypothetical protein
MTYADTPVDADVEYSKWRQQYTAQTNDCKMMTSQIMAFDGSDRYFAV